MKHSTALYLPAFAITALSSTLLTSHAQPPRMGPPPEAIEACANQAQGQACQFQSPRGQITGQCITTPKGTKACAPAHRRGKEHRAPANRESFSFGQSRENNQRARGGMGQAPRRQHTTTQSSGTFTPVPANQSISGQRVNITVQGNYRILQSNGLPDHATGQFPNQGNPNTIRSQQYSYRIPAKPQFSGRITPLKRQSFGLAVNGIPFDPGAAEFYLGNPENGWNYEALSGAVALGIDTNNAHVQPTGAYHYHGKPTGLLQSAGLSGQRHSPLIGWAADGFPIYAIVGYKDGNNANSGQTKMVSSWRIKQGQRSSGHNQPGGRYDGTFVQDFEYIVGSGTLDECNGRQTITPEFPQGTYAYFITDSWPVIPRCYKGTPSADFKRRR